MINNQSPSYQHSSATILFHLITHVCIVRFPAYRLLYLPEDLYAPVIDGIDMDSIMLVDESGHVGGQVTFAEDLNLLDGLTSDTNILDGCNLVEVWTCQLHTALNMQALVSEE